MLKFLKKINFLLVLISLMLISGSVSATNGSAPTSASGCVSDDTGFLYPNPSGVSRYNGYGPSYNTTPVITSFGTGKYCKPTNMGRCVIRSREDCRECTGPYDYDRSDRYKDMWYEQKGVLTYYVACPIDDYVGLILVAVAGLGFAFIRKGLLA